MLLDGIHTRGRTLVQAVMSSSFMISSISKRLMHLTLKMTDTRLLVFYAFSVFYMCCMIILIYSKCGIYYQLSNVNNFPLFIRDLRIQKYVKDLHDSRYVTVANNISVVAQPHGQKAVGSLISNIERERNSSMNNHLKKYRFVFKTAQNKIINNSTLAISKTSTVPNVKRQKNLRQNGQYFNKTHFQMIKRDEMSASALVDDGVIDRGTDVSKKAAYVVNTDGCKIEAFDPNDWTIKQYVRHHMPLVCSGPPALTTLVKGRLSVNPEVQRVFYPNVTECAYHPLRRPNASHADVWSTIEDGVTFTRKVNVTDEFIKVECIGADINTTVYTNFHAQIIEKDKVRDKSHKSTRGKVGDRLSVLMLGLESTSRLNFIRQLTKTHGYIKTKMKSFDLKGFTKVGDNTIVNIMPMLTGKFLGELEWNNNSQPFDDIPFIWKSFAENNFVTLKAEDRPWIGIFNVDKKGFLEQPMDYYLRTLFIPLTLSTLNDSSTPGCIGPKPKTELLLDWVTEFLRKHRNNRYFVFSFLTAFMHDELNGLSRVRQIIHQFITSIHEDGLLNNTVFILYGDHGFRYGPMRQTLMGKFEERNAAMNIIFPEWFLSKYPVIARNLKTNENRFTTFFDVYETLQDILKINKNETINMSSTRRRGISLLTEIPGNRTCASAAILPHWCICQQMTPLSTNSTLAVRMARMVVSDINDMLIDTRDKCDYLIVSHIRDIRQFQINRLIKDYRIRNDERNEANESALFLQKERVRSKAVHYMVTFDVMPSNATFEASVVCDNHVKDCRIIDEISRLDRYSKQSACVKHVPSLKKFCYCKIQTNNMTNGPLRL